MSQHNGLFIALRLSPNAAAKLALPGGEPADRLHLTLLYGGDVDALGADAVGKIASA